MEQLVVIGAYQAAGDSLLHYVRRLELGGSLAHLFFDDCHVAITDTSYRKQLRELWQLRYLNCLFTCRMTTLMVALEGLLQKQLMLPDGDLLTEHRAPLDQVQRGEQPYCRAVEKVRQRPLASGKKGVIYVRTDLVGEVVSAELSCPFYKATAVDKNETLQGRIDEPGG